MNVDQVVPKYSSHRPGNHRPLQAVGERKLSLKWLAGTQSKRRNSPIGRNHSDWK